MIVLVYGMSLLESGDRACSQEVDNHGHQV